MPGKFVVKKGTTGRFRFVLLAGNSQVIATSEAYQSKAACLNGIRSVKRFAPDAAVEDQTAAPAMKVKARVEKKKAAAGKPAASRR